MLFRWCYGCLDLCKKKTQETCILSWYSILKQGAELDKSFCLTLWHFVSTCCMCQSGGFSLNDNWHHYTGNPLRENKSVQEKGLIAFLTDRQECSLTCVTQCSIIHKMEGDGKQYICLSSFIAISDKYTSNKQLTC